LLLFLKLRIIPVSSYTNQQVPSTADPHQVDHFYHAESIPVVQVRQPEMSGPAHTGVKTVSNGQVFARNEM